MSRFDLQTAYLHKSETKIYFNRSFLAHKCVEIPTSEDKSNAQFYFFFQATYRNRAAEVPVVFSSEGIVHEKSVRMKYNSLRSELLR